MESVIVRRGSQLGPDFGVCAIVVLYEDNSSRDAAIHLCQSLERTFNEELSFEVTWCRFRYFNDSAVACEAAEAAAHADLILVSIQHDQDLPLEIKAWFERWLPNRDSSVGALVLLQTATQPQPARCPVSPGSYLYLLAQRANLDFLFLSDVGPAAPTERIPQNLIVSQPLILDNIRNSRLHSRSGINE